MGLDPDSPALPKLCINLQREALERTKTVDVKGVATEKPYQCAGLAEFCKYEDCTANDMLKAPERPRATPLDREDLATLRLFVDPDRRAALAGGKRRIHNALGIAPKARNECSRCMETSRTPAARAKHFESIKNRTADQLVSGDICAACRNRKADGKNTGQGREPPCAACAAKRAAKAAAAAGSSTDPLPAPT